MSSKWWKIGSDVDVGGAKFLEEDYHSRTPPAISFVFFLVMRSEEPRTFHKLRQAVVVVGPPQGLTSIFLREEEAGKLPNTEGDGIAVAWGKDAGFVWFIHVYRYGGGGFPLFTLVGAVGAGKSVVSGKTVCGR